MIELPPRVLLDTRYPGPFYRLLTKPDGSLLHAGLCFDSTLVRVREYIGSVLKGDGKKAHCPFVQLIEQRDGYHVGIFPQHPSAIDFPSVVGAIEKRFRELSPSETFCDQPVDVTTTVAAFSHSEANTSDFCRALDQARDEHRRRFLDQGLMLAQMHPFHALGSSSARKADDPGTDPLYRSGIPLLMTRRMHKEDVVFMHNDEAMTAYRKFFP